MDFILTWANAVAQFEGFGADPANRPTRNHNPGNLKFAGQPGAIGKDPDNFAVFSDDGAGFQALIRQLQKYVTDFPNFSILEITSHYLGQPAPTVDSQGDAFSYAGYVASQLGVDASTTLAQLANGAGDVMATAVSPLPATIGENGIAETPNLIWLAVGGMLIFWVISRVFGGQ